MEDLALKAIYWLITFTGSLGIAFGLIWLSFQLLTRILKMLGLWKDTVKIMYIYFAMKRGDKTFRYKGELYKIEKGQNNE